MKVQRIALAAVPATIATACADLPTFGAQEPSSDQGQQILELWQGFFIASAIVGAFVLGLVIWVIVRYRRRNDDLPEQSHGNNRLEVVYTVVPIVIVTGLFAFTIGTQLQVDDLSDQPDVVVEVIGFQWQWQFNYVDDDVSITGAPDAEPELVLPVDSTVRFKLSSRDVIHSFFVPDFLFKRDVIPGVDNEFDVTVTRTGTFAGHCAEFCGLLHDQMGFTVRSVPRDRYDAWLDANRGAGA